MNVLRVEPLGPRPGELDPAVAWLRRGRVVAFPTETFYGLAVDPASADAVAALFDLKGRPADLALPLIASSRDSVEAWAGGVPALTARLAEGFWPGPLSLIVDAPALRAPGVAAADGTVAVRVPGHPVARGLAAAFGGPLTSTSANRSGSKPARRVEELNSIATDPRVLVVDGGDSPGGLASTIVDARRDAPRLLREGAVPWSRVLEFLH